MHDRSGLDQPHFAGVGVQLNAEHFGRCAADRPDDVVADLVDHYRIATQRVGQAAGHIVAVATGNVQRVSLRQRIFNVVVIRIKESVLAEVRRAKQPGKARPCRGVRNRRVVRGQRRHRDRIRINRRTVVLEHHARTDLGRVGRAFDEAEAANVEGGLVLATTGILDKDPVVVTISEIFDGIAGLHADNLGSVARNDDIDRRCVSASVRVLQDCPA